MPGAARPSVATQGTALLGRVRRGKAGDAGMARCGDVRQGQARRGTAWLARHGDARRGRAWQGLPGQGRVRHGKAWQSLAKRGLAGLARQCCPDNVRTGVPQRPEGVVRTMSGQG